MRLGVFVERAAGDAGLICDNDDLPVQFIGPKASQFENPEDKFEWSQRWT
jgi:hypothetical protein